MRRLEGGLATQVIKVERVGGGGLRSERASNLVIFLPGMLTPSLIAGVSLSGC